MYTIYLFFIRLTEYSKTLFYSSAFYTVDDTNILGFISFCFI